MKKLKIAIINNKYLLLIFTLSLALRYVGMWHSFPQILHPDEPTIVQSALGIRFDINPHHFDWPHLYIYLNYFAYMIFAYFRDTAVVLNLKPLLSSIFPLMWNDDLIFYLITRFLTATFGALTIFPIYLAARNLFSKNVALFSALVIALAPFHVWHSQYSLSDVPMAFLVAWVVYFSTQIFLHNNTKYYIYAGIFVGLAASTKYNGVLVCITVVLAHLLRLYSTSSGYKGFISGIFSLKQMLNLFLAGLTSILMFFIGTPFALLDYSTFSRTDSAIGAYWQFTNVGSVNLQTQIYKFFTLFFSKLLDDFGYTFLIGYLIVTLIYFVNLFKRNFQNDLIKLTLLILPSLYFFWYIAGFEKSRSHYYFIVYPYVAILSGYFVHAHLLKIKNKNIKNIAIIFYYAFPLLMVILNNLSRYNYL